MARISSRFGHEFEMALITARICTTSLMLAVAALLFLYLTLAASEDEAFSLNLGVLPVMGRFLKTTYRKGCVFIWGRRRQQVDNQAKPTEVSWSADARVPGELIAAEGLVTVPVPERSEIGTQVGHSLQDRGAQATEEADAAASAPVVMSYIPANYHGIVAPKTQIVMHRLEKLSGCVESVCAGAVQPRLPAMPDYTKDSAPRPLEPDWILQATAEPDRLRLADWNSGAVDMEPKGQVIYLGLGARSGKDERGRTLRRHPTAGNECFRPSRDVEPEILAHRGDDHVPPNVAQWLVRGPSDAVACDEAVVTMRLFTSPSTAKDDPRTFTHASSECAYGLDMVLKM